MAYVKVNYYDDKHRKLLAQLPRAKQLDQIVQSGFDLPVAEFLAYTIFREQKDHDGWKTYNDLQLKLPSRVAMFNDYFATEEDSIFSKYPQGKDMDNAMTEAAGVGVSLALISDLYGLTEADWAKIPVSEFKDLDFEIAATETEIVEVEAKGAVLKDPSSKQGIYGRAQHIENKKVVQRQQQNNKNTLLGVITAIP